MDAQTVIHHRLDLAIRLLDSVSGKAVTSRDVRFVTQSPGKNAVSRGGGLYLFLNTEREDFEMEIHVYGYEYKKIRISYPKDIEEPMPIREVYLLPLDNPVIKNVLSLRGNLQGIEEIEAVSLTDVNCCIKEFDARKRIMTVLNQRNIKFHNVHYGLINRQKTSYEHFEVEKEISQVSFKTKKKLEKEFFINQPITRVIFGQVTEQGDYVLKVTNDQTAQYLVRFVVNGEEFYQKVDFHAENNFLECLDCTQKEKEV